MGNSQSRHLLLKKHTATIHCSNTLSLLQRKISNALLFAAYDNLLTQEVHQISIKELCGLIEYRGNNYPAIKDALRQLVSTLIEWNLINDIGEDDWTASSILASVQLKGAQCFYAYSPHMKQLLHSPQVYGVINLSIQAKFKSAYSLALYENVARYKNLPSTKWFELELFRSLMGVPDDQYMVFRDFNRRVLAQSMKEVNAFSDLMIEPEIKRVGREVKAIRFKFEKRALKAVEEGVVKLDLDIETRLKEYGLSKVQARKITMEYDSSVVLEKIKLIESSAGYKKGEIKNLAAYLMKALREDYQPAISSNVVQLKQKSEKEKVVELQQQQDVRKQEYDSYVNDQIKDYLAGLTVDEYQEMERAFLQGLDKENNTHALKLYKKHKLNHAATMAMFNLYVRANHAEILRDLRGFEDF